MKAVFEWRGKNYVVSHSSFQLRIHTEEGLAVTVNPSWSGANSGAKLGLAVPGSRLRGTAPQQLPISYPRHPFGARQVGVKSS